MLVFFFSPREKSKRNNRPKKKHQLVTKYMTEKFRAPPKRPTKLVLHRTHLMPPRLTYVKSAFLTFSSDISYFYYYFLCVLLMIRNRIEEHSTEWCWTKWELLLFYYYYYYQWIRAYSPPDAVVAVLVQCIFILLFFAVGRFADWLHIRETTKK